MTDLIALPFVFTFLDAVDVRGFKAKVTSRGRVLAASELPEGVWFNGVRPGAIAAGAATFLEAFGKFRENYRLVLADMAEGAASFEAFRTSVKTWFHEGDEMTDADWHAAVEAVRAYGPAKLGFPIANADTVPLISVEEVKECTLQANSSDLTEVFPTLAAA